jgi:glutaconyl-CoA decarboxylase
MRQYFERMAPVGRALSKKERERQEADAREITKVEEEVAQSIEKRKDAGIPIEKLHKRGEKTAWERVELLVDSGSFLPLNSLYDPEFNQEGTTGVITGLGKISGRYASIIASDNKFSPGPGYRDSGSTCFGPKILQSNCVFPSFGY